MLAFSGASNSPPSALNYFTPRKNHRCPFCQEREKCPRFGYTAHPVVGCAANIAILLETWPSGRRHTPAKGASGQNLDPGFESLRLRQLFIKTRMATCFAGFYFARSS